MQIGDYFNRRYLNAILRRLGNKKQTTKRLALSLDKIGGELPSATIGCARYKCK